MSSPVPSMMSSDVRRGPAALAGQARQMPALQPYASLWKGGLGAAYGRPVPGPARGGFLTAVRPSPSLPLAGVS